MTTSLLILSGRNVVKCTSFFPAGKRTRKVKLEDYDVTTQTLLRNSDGVLVNAKGLREPVCQEQIKQLEES